ncbi:MAG: hypothetical protein AAF358_13575 [Pseudomonadota bacterium]
MKTPDEIKEHQSRFRDGAWKWYAPDELASWVILLGKRATHRTEPEKAAKDITDAQNYLAMLEAWLHAQAGCLTPPESES